MINYNNFTVAVYSNCHNWNESLGTTNKKCYLQAPISHFHAPSIAKTHDVFPHREQKMKKQLWNLNNALEQNKEVKLGSKGSTMQGHDKVQKSSRKPVG